MPGSELVNLVLQLDTEWGPHEENTALLLETLTAQLDWGWADRTIDPDDPEVQAERRKHGKTKPPPHPILRPVAWRPNKEAAERLDTYVDELTKYAKPQQAADPFELHAKWRQQHGKG
jgi:hypothetical protein